MNKNLIPDTLAAMQARARSRLKRPEVTSAVMADYAFHHRTERKEGERNCRRRMSPELWEIDDLLTRWGRETAGDVGLDLPRASAHEAVSHAKYCKPKLTLSDEIVFIDGVIAFLKPVLRAVIEMEYQRALEASLDVKRNRLGIKKWQWTQRLREARKILLSAWSTFAAAQRLQAKHNGTLV